MTIKEEIIKVLNIEIKHLNGHLGEEQIKMFSNPNQNKYHKTASKQYLNYKARIYQTQRIINLIKEGWKDE